MEVLVHEYNPDQWRLFTDASEVYLKMFQLHHGKRFPSVPLSHAANMKESYESIWESLSMTDLSGSYMVMTRLWLCYSECNSGTKNTAISYASGTAGTRRIPM